MTQHCDDWSPYYNTLVGQFEYWTLTIMREAFQRNLDNWPSTYYGGLNSIDLYLHHNAYSPFLPLAYYLKQPMTLEWRQDTADFVAEQLRRERDGEPRQVLVQELVHCPRCKKLPLAACTDEHIGGCDIAKLPHEERRARWRGQERDREERAAMRRHPNAVRLRSLEAT